MPKPPGRYCTCFTCDGSVPSRRSRLAIDGGFYSRLGPRVVDLNSDAIGRHEMPQPGRVLDSVLRRFGRAARHVGRDHHIAFNVSNDTMLRLGGFVVALDPQHCFVAGRPRCVLGDRAVPAQNPHFVRSLLPALGLVGPNRDRRGLIRRWQIDVRAGDVCERENCGQKDPNRRPCTAGAHASRSRHAQRKPGKKVAAEIVSRRQPRRDAWANASVRPNSARNGAKQNETSCET